MSGRTAWTLRMRWPSAFSTHSARRPIAVSQSTSTSSRPSRLALALSCSVRLAPLGLPEGLPDWPGLNWVDAFPDPFRHGSHASSDTHRSHARPSGGTGPLPGAGRESATAANRPAWVASRARGVRKVRAAPQVRRRSAARDSSAARSAGPLRGQVGREPVVDPRMQARQADERRARLDRADVAAAAPAGPRRGPRLHVRPPVGVDPQQRDRVAVPRDVRPLVDELEPPVDIFAAAD